MPAQRPMWMKRSKRRGAISVQILAFLVPVFFGLMGFAIDLGRLYSAKGELKTAAESMALAAAGQLIGNDASTTAAGDAARRMVETGSGFANRYDFGGLAIGEATGSLSSEITDPTYYASAAEATGQGEAPSGATTSGEVTGSQARHVRVEITGETPLTFWRFLSLGQDGRVPIRVRAAAGLSAPVCTACGIEPIAVAAIDASDTVNFGFTAATRYTLGYTCTGAPVPQPLAGNTAGGRVPYVILNRLSDTATVFADESQQLFRTGAQGLLPSTTEAQSCFRVNAEESIWATASQTACNSNTVSTSVRSYLCGLATRMDITNVQGCTAIADVDTLNGLYSADSDLTELDDYAGYTGNTRRILTIVIVEALNPTGTMLVLGYRQFLLEPVQNLTNINPSDTNGRFGALYLGTVAPLRQGRAGDCAITNGPGKVVLHR